MFLEEKSDEELMVLYQKGSEQAFQVLYSRHAAKIFNFIRSRIRDSEKSFDVFQEVFVKIHRSKHLYNQNLPILPWIFTITRNALIDEVRKSGREANHEEYQDSHLVFSESRPADSLLELGAVIEGLPANQRQAIELRYYEEKTFDEIAQTLKTSPLNVRKLVSRGVKRLRDLLYKGDRS